MLEHDPLNYHPLENDRSTAIAPADLLRFIADCGHHPRLVDLDDHPPPDHRLTGIAVPPRSSQ
jgi:Ala-tRNA(Pro) deacylase